MITIDRISKIRQYKQRQQGIKNSEKDICELMYKIERL